MSKPVIDILMITYNRSQYTQMALKRLLDTCDEQMRVWVWHNGNDAETLAVVKGLATHPRIHRFHHSEQNARLRPPTNWMWTEGDGEFVCKVDDDCLMPDNWGQTLREAHAANPQFGAIGCWRFFPEDFVPELANKKIQEFNGHKILRNCWTEGSGYVMKRKVIEECGVLKEDQSWVQYNVEIAAKGWINGWYYPFLYQEHMDDPLSPNTLLKTDEDLKKYMPLTAEKNGTMTLKAWNDLNRRAARQMQECSYDPSHYLGWRKRWKGIKRRLRALMGAKEHW
jgi:glycosyltransferase involved in cell wall biosynthesis